MPTRKVALTLPDHVLSRLDRWARQLGQSRSRFVAEKMDQALGALEENEITASYDTAYSKQDARAENADLAEDLLRLTPPDRGDE